MTKKCPYCGFDNEDSSVHCQECGKEIEVEITSKKGFWASINWTAVILGLLVGLLVWFLTAKSFGYTSFLLILPLVSGLVSGLLANDVNYKEGIKTGIISVIVLGVPLLILMGAGLILILCGAVGGFLGVLLNKYIFKSKTSADGENLSRVFSIQKWWNKQGNGIKSISIIIVIILAIGLFFGGIQMQITPSSNNNTTQTSQVNNTSVSTTPTPTNQTPVDDEVLLDKSNVRMANGVIYVDNKVVGTYTIVSSPPAVSEDVDKRTWRDKRVEYVDFSGTGKYMDYYTQFNGQWIKLSIDTTLSSTALEITNDIYTAME